MIYWSGSFSSIWEHTQIVHGLKRIKGMPSFDCLALVANTLHLSSLYCKDSWNHVLLLLDHFLSPITSLPSPLSNLQQSPLHGWFQCLLSFLGSKINIFISYSSKSTTTVMFRCWARLGCLSGGFGQIFSPSYSLWPFPVVPSGFSDSLAWGISVWKSEFLPQ